MIQVKDTKRELREFLVEVDSLLSCLFYRHGKYLEEIGEKEEVGRLATEARRRWEEVEK